MTESEPMSEPIGSRYRPTAGEVGLHRQEPGTATPESAGPSLNVPQVHVPAKAYVKPVVSHGTGDPLAGLSGPPGGASAHDRMARPEPSRHTGPEGVAMENRAEMPGGASPEGTVTHRDSRLSQEDLLRDDIVRTREELGLTVEALAHKADVRGRARQKVAEKKTAAKEKVSEVADRLGIAAGHSSRTASTPPERQGLPAVLDRVSAEARRRPAMIIAIGAATMAGAGYLAWADRHSRSRLTGRTR